MQNPFWKAGRKEDGKPFDHVRERHALAEGYRALLEQAGIGAQIDQCADILEPDHAGNGLLPPTVTPAGSKAGKRQDAETFATYRYCVRDTVFAVPDQALRRELIAWSRKFDALRVRSAQDGLRHAERRRDEARRGSSLRPFLDALGGGILVLVGWALGGPMWGLAAAVFALIGAMHGVSGLQRAQRRTLGRASAAVARLQEELHAAAGQEVFNQQEEATGDSQDDPDC